MNAFKKIIFVSNEDKTRAPMATAIMATLLKNRGFIFESRGMVVLFAEPYNTKAIEAAAIRGINLTSTFSRQLTAKDFEIDTLVLTIDVSQKNKIYKLYKEAINVFTLSEFALEEDVTISNPYGKGIEEYLKCFDEIYKIVEVAAKKLK